MQTKNKKMLEKNFQAKIIKELKKRGIYYIKVIQATKNGVPDLIICYKGKFYALEVKTDTGKTTSLQDYNIDQITQSGGTALVVRPNNWEKVKKIFDIN